MSSFTECVSTNNLRPIRRHELTEGLRIWIGSPLWPRMTLRAYGRTIFDSGRISIWELSTGLKRREHYIIEANQDMISDDVFVFVAEGDGLALTTPLCNDGHAGGQQVTTGFRGW